MSRFFLCLLTAVLLNGCYKSDIDELRDELEKQSQRIEALEKWLETVNTNISSLQILVSALEENDYVTSITPVTENGVEVGYRITFMSNDPIVILHGKNGEDAITPQMGIAQEGGTTYYWTVDYGDGPEFLTDNKGNKIPVTGNDGVSAVTPQIRIQDGYWEISTNGGQSWTSTGVKATGENGSQGGKGEKGDKGEKGESGDSVFAENGVDITNDDYVIFTLTNGRTITLPRFTSIRMIFNEPTDLLLPGETIRISYDIEPILMTAAVDLILLNVPRSWDVTIDRQYREIVITAPQTLTLWDYNPEITILLSDGKGYTLPYSFSVMTEYTGVGGNKVGAFYYEKGIPAGIVFRSYDASRGSDLEHGLVLHPTAGPELQWSTAWKQFNMSDWSGMDNMNIIRNETNWEMEYPLFKWASDLGTQWYIPAVHELQHLYCSYMAQPFENWATGSSGNDESRPSFTYNAFFANQFNAIINGIGGDPMTGPTWSSSEYKTNPDRNAWSVGFYDGATTNGFKTNMGRSARAVMAFDRSYDIIYPSSVVTP